MQTYTCLQGNIYYLCILYLTLRFITLKWVCNDWCKISILNRVSYGCIFRRVKIPSYRFSKFWEPGTWIHVSARLKNMRGLSGQNLVSAMDMKKFCIRWNSILCLPLPIPSFPIICSHVSKLSQLLQTSYNKKLYNNLKRQFAKVIIFVLFRF